MIDTLAGVAKWTGEHWSDVLATVAFVVSVGGGTVRWWGSRAARFSVMWEQFVVSVDGPFRQQSRLRITNHGPAVMRDVDVDIFDNEGAEWIDRIKARWPTMPIAEIHPGESVFLEFTFGIHGTTPEIALITWRDNRRGAQSSRRLITRLYVR